jgi:hypothetical protein
MRENKLGLTSLFGVIYFVPSIQSNDFKLSKSIKYSKAISKAPNQRKYVYLQ